MGPPWDFDFQNLTGSQSQWFWFTTISQRRSREELLAPYSHMHLISFFLSLFTHGNADRRRGKTPRETVKRRDDCMPPKAIKTEESALSEVVVQVGKYLPSCSPGLFSVLHILKYFFHRMNHKIQRIKRGIRKAEGWAGLLKWKGMKRSARPERCSKLLCNIPASTDTQFPGKFPSLQVKTCDNWKGCAQQ